MSGWDILGCNNSGCDDSDCDNLSRDGLIPNFPIHQSKIVNSAGSVFDERGVKREEKNEGRRSSWVEQQSSGAVFLKTSHNSCRQGEAETQHLNLQELMHRDVCC